MSARISLIFYSAWSAVVAVAILALGMVQLFGESAATPEWIYFLCVALFHGIFAIWCAKGRTAAAFQRASVVGRLVTAVFALTILLQSPAAPAGAFREQVLIYYTAATMLLGTL
jgi:hypothetical protein